MKKIFLSLALTLLASGVMAQSAEDKAKAKAEAAALKAAKKEAKTQMAEATKIKDAIYLKVQDKENPAKEEEVFAESQKGLDLITKALKSGHIEEKKLGEAYKVSEMLAMLRHNLYLGKASEKQTFDTVAYYDNLKLLCDGLHNELKYTKPTPGETGNAKELEGKKANLASSAVYFVYAAQFEGDCKRYDRALEAYDIALNYGKLYPEVADQVKLPVEPAQIAYYAFHIAHEGKKYEAMDKYYEQALQFADGVQGTNQVRLMSYLEQGDTATWASKAREQCLADPGKNEDLIQILASYYQKKGHDKMGEFADAVLAVDPNVLIANYARGFVYFAETKYDEAMKYYQKCTEIKPDYYDAWYQCGLCIFRKALDLNSSISSIKNQAEAKKTKEQTIKLFGEAIPYFERAREITPDEPQKWAYELKQCYTVTGQAAKAAEMDKLL